MAFAVGKGVFDWPEWKAFAARLGIVEVPTVGLTIRLHVDEVVRVTHDYLPTKPSVPGGVMYANDSEGISHTNHCECTRCELARADEGNTIREVFRQDLINTLGIDVNMSRPVDAVGKEDSCHVVTAQG